MVQVGYDLGESEPTKIDDKKHMYDPIRMYLSEIGEIPLLTSTQEFELTSNMFDLGREILHSIYQLPFGLEAGVDFIRDVYVRKG